MKTRRTQLTWLAAIVTFPLLLRRADAQDDGLLTYRGFTADVSAVEGAPDSLAILISLKHQLDIVADCGAKPEIIDFFKSQRVTLKVGAGDAGKFNSHIPGVTVNAAVQAPDKPIVLHELLHAYHYRVMPGGFENPDIQHFYDFAAGNSLYRSALT